MEYHSSKLERVAQCGVCGSADLALHDRVISLAQCRNCGFLFRSPRPTLEEIAGYYSGDSQYDHWLSRSASRQILWRRRLKMVERRRDSGRLLDVGAGIGEFLAHARDHRFSVEGTEISSRALELARNRYGVVIRAGNLEDIEFGSSRFGVITIFHVLEHVHSPRSLLERCRELLTDDGLIVIAVPNETRSWKRLPKTLLSLAGSRRFRKTGRYALPPLDLTEPGSEVHLSHFTSASLHALVTRCGFTVIDESIDPCHATAGISRAVHELMYYSCVWIYRLTGVNFGEALWLTAVKQRDG